VTAALDNHVWHAPTGPHAELALGRGKARHYPREIAPFSAIAEAAPAAYADLAADLPRRTEVRLFRLTNEAPHRAWEALSTEPIFQLVCDADALPPATDLGPEDTAEMPALIGETKVGPFGPRTCELDRHAKDYRLIAMGGERLRADRHAELSAIAVHPGARGHGLSGYGDGLRGVGSDRTWRNPVLPCVPQFSGRIVPADRISKMYDALGYLEPTIH
jgi:hypothetical protein